ANVRETNLPLWLSTGGRAGTTAGTYTRSTDVLAFTPVAGSIYTGVEFGDVPANTWAAGGAQNVGPGAPAFYPHRFTAGSAGSVLFGSSQVAALPWTIDLVRDTNCNGTIDAGETMVSGPIVVTAGEQLCFVMRHTAPAGAPAGANAQATLSA